MTPVWKVLVTDGHGLPIAVVWLPYDPGPVTTETEQVSAGVVPSDHGEEDTGWAGREGSTVLA